jgi:LuxR family transcriptional regulator, maltose regulon positive regulatory protein
MVDRAESEPFRSLAGTKFFPPMLREDVIPRQRLLEALYSRLASHRFTLLSAPAGYGKTTLLAALSHAQPELPFAWLSLDEEDNDPIRFLTALIAALQRLNPACGRTAQNLLRDPANPNFGTRRVASVLINDILETQEGPFALVLDDLHLISEPAIFIALDYLLEYSPPQLHLVVATRVDPPLALARLRARGQLAELRLSELRFSDREVKTFLNDYLHMDLEAYELSLLHSHTEGWPVGLRLLASSLDQSWSIEDRRLFIDHLVQTDRNIFDFLAEEVFNREASEIKTFLLETSILPELTPMLCLAVTRRSDAGVTLEELYRHNLFLVRVSPLSGQANSALDQPQIQTEQQKSETRYRYHDLFVEFLRHKLQQEMPERVPELHFLAAQAESDPIRAVGHYLAASRYQEAAEVIEQIGAEMFAHGYLDTLSRWISRLPVTVRDGHPILLHYLSNIAFLQGSWEQVESLLERALQGFKVAGDEAGQGEVLVDLATCAVGLSDIERGSVLYGKALAYPIPTHTRVQALLGHALATGALGEWQQVQSDFETAMSLFQPTGELDLLYLVTFPYFHPNFAFLPGGLKKLEHICDQARALIGDQVSPSRLMIEEMVTVLHLYRGQLVDAIRTGESALALRKRLGGHVYMSLNAALFLILAHAARGNYSAVEPLIEPLLLGVDQTDQPTPDLAAFLFYLGRVRWLQGRLKEAREIYARICTFMDEDPRRGLPEARTCRVWMQSLLEISAGRYAEAERLLRKAVVFEQKDRGSAVHGCTRLMLARLYWQQGRQQEALAELNPALTYHEQLGIPFTILLEGQSIVPLLRMAVEQGIHERYANDMLAILGADGEPRPVHVPQTGETLTPREVEVLRLVVAGYSNRAIAEQLVISEWTVKSHLTKNYRKLNVSSRTQAIARARALGLG